MKRIYKHLSDNSVLALYLALRAARKGAVRVVISNAALRSHLGVGTLHKPKIAEFAATLKPISTRHVMSNEHNGQKNCLILYLNEKDDPSVQVKTERISMIPDQATIDNALPIKRIELNT